MRYVKREKKKQQQKTENKIILKHKIKKKDNKMATNKQKMS